MRLFPRSPRGRRSFAAIAAPFLATTLVVGCDGCYYVRLGIGQARVVLGREAIEDALARPNDLTGAERANLALVPEIRKYAIETIRSPANGATDAAIGSTARQWRRHEDGASVERSSR